jgi:hypothetical protein
MLGLMGLFGRRLPRSRRQADAGRKRDDRPSAPLTERLGFNGSSRIGGSASADPDAGVAICIPPASGGRFRLGMHRR